MRRISILIALLPLSLSCEKENMSINIIEATVGDSFKIELKANWATGYHWSWLNWEDITVADTTELKYISNDPDLPGASGKEIWTFKAISKGDETLIFKYLSPGTTGNNLEKSKEIRVIVDD